MRECTDDGACFFGRCLHDELVDGDTDERRCFLELINDDARTGCVSQMMSRYATLSPAGSKVNGCVIWKVMIVPSRALRCFAAPVLRTIAPSRKPLHYEPARLTFEHR